MTRFRSKNRSKKAIFEQIGQNLKKACSHDKFCFAKFVEKVLIFCLRLSSTIWLRQELVLKFALFSRQHVACVGSIPWSHEMIRERTKTQPTRACPPRPYLLQTFRCFGRLRHDRPRTLIVILQWDIN